MASAAAGARRQLLTTTHSSSGGNSAWKHATDGSSCKRASAPPWPMRSTASGAGLRIKVLVKRRLLVAVGFLASLVALTTSVHAESGEDAWLRYARLEARAAQQYQALPRAIVALGDSELIRSAQQEVIRGLEGMLGGSIHVAKALPSEPAIIV